MRVVTKRKRGHWRASTTAGFTLIEILIVLALIGMILAAIPSGLFKSLTGGQEKTAGILVARVKEAAALYKLDHNGACPESLDALGADGWVKTAEKDPWGGGRRGQV